MIIDSQLELSKAQSLVGAAGTVVSTNVIDQGSDADQHVNNVAFYRYMEEARMRWVHTLGLAMTPPAPIPVLAASACSFRASADGWNGFLRFSRRRI